MSLRELLEEAGADLVDMDVSREPGGITWSRAGRPFAALSSDGSTAEFELDRAVALAATRTPDCEPSDRGPGWVRFSPRVQDGHAEDRARAWFLSAFRGQLQSQG